jgi:hypothetical protein
MNVNTVFTPIMAKLAACAVDSDMPADRKTFVLYELMK